MTDGGSRDHHEDNQLMQALAQAASATDTVPPEVVAAAKATFTWLTIDAELAALTFDSVTDAEARAGVRGTGGPRALTFELDDIVVEVEVTEHAGRRSLVGQISPTPVEWVELHEASSSQPVRLEPDALGRFRASSLTAGPFRLLCRFAAGARWPVMLTEWVTI